MLIIACAHRAYAHHAVCMTKILTADMTAILALILRKNASEKQLRRQYKDHELGGKLRRCRECRVDPDNDDWATNILA